MSTIKADNFEGSLPGNPIILKTNSTERMRIDTTGNVGIGTAPTSYKLTVGGSSPQFSIIDSGANLSRALITVTPSGVSFGNTYNGTAIPLAFNIGVTEVARFSTSGNFGIGTASPAVALDVTGEARSSTSTTISSNAKTLTTKDYVDSLTKIGAVNFVVVTNHVIQHQTVSGHFSVVSNSIRCPAGQTWTATLLYWDSSAVPPAFTANITDTVGVSTATGTVRTFTYAMVRIA